MFNFVVPLCTMIRVILDILLSLRKRVSLRNPKVIMTTKVTDDLWNEVQAFVAHEYSLENTQVVSNSDGGSAYLAEKFRQAF